jgi:CRISPR-associated protein (TIGR02710 family)
LARWDRFEHYQNHISQDLIRAIEQVKRALRSLNLRSYEFENFVLHLENFAKHVEAIQAKNTISLEFVTDIFLNADRRIKRNRYDDAVARHYRTLEAISQFCLLSIGITSDSPDYGKLNEEQIHRFIVPLNKSTLPDKIDLKVGFWLLRILNHPVKGFVFKGKETYKDFTFEGILLERNSSILAHGFKPIGKEKAEKFHRNLAELLSGLFENEFIRIQKNIQLPKMPEIGF